jgi:hypothetical protein
MPVSALTRSGARSRTSAASASSPLACCPIAAASCRPSSRIVFSMPASSQGSPSGRSGCHSNCAAVSERRGSTTTTRPPRAVIAAICSLTRPAVSMLPWVTTGLAPSTSRKSVWAKSGNGVTRLWP